MEETSMFNLKTGLINSWFQQNVGPFTKTEEEDIVFISHFRKQRNLDILQKWNGPL